MSVIKFAVCRNFLLERRDIKVYHFIISAVSPAIPRHILSLKQLLPSDCLNKCLYATSAKPHMTPALHKWKQKKKKSRVQQNKEMDKLHEDLVKLLTKRAIALVKNKSLLETHRGVVTTHVFTNFPHREAAERDMANPDPADVQFFYLRKHSDYVAETVEAQLLERFKDLEKSSGENKSHKQDVSTLGMSSAISLSDVFHDAKYSKKTAVTGSSGDFHRDLQTFKSELEAVVRHMNTASSSSVYSWDVDIPSHSHEDEADSTTNLGKVTHKNIAHATESQLRNITVTGSDHELSSDGFEQEMEPLLTEHQNMQMGHPGWDLYHTMMDPENNSFHEELDEFLASSHPVPGYHNILSGPSQAELIPSESSNNKRAIKQTITSHGEIEEKLDRRVSRGIHIAKGKTLSTQVGIQEMNIPLVKSPVKEKTPQKKIEHMNVNRELQELTDKSFVEVSSFTGSEMVAVRNLQYQASRYKLTSVEVFNKLIHALAKKRDLHTIRLLFSMMRQQELSPTLQTYAGCLECLGRTVNVDRSVCEKLLADISKKELELKEIANTCSFESDEWDYVLKAIRLVDPSFVPNPPKLITEYDNQLLTALNSPCAQTLEKNPYALDLSPDELHARAKTQIEMEKRGEVDVKSILISAAPGGTDPKLKQMRDKLLDEWRQALIKSFEQKLAVYQKKARDNVIMTLYPYLKLFPPEEYVNIIFKTLRELLSLSEGYSPVQSLILNNMGRAVCRKYNTQSKVASGMGVKMLRLHQLYMDSYLNKDQVLDSHRLVWLRSMNQSYDTINMDMSVKRWPAHIIREVGRFLLDLVLYDLKVNANLFRPRAPGRLVPAFCAIFRPDASFVTNAEIKLHPVVSKLFSSDSMESFTFDPSTVPMIVPPVPWISKNMGGLLLGSNALVRLGSDVYHVDALKAVPERQFPAVLDSLNTLSSCAWKINKPILDLQIEIFNNKGDAQLKVAPPATELPPMPALTENMSSKEKALLYRERLQLQQQKQDMHGLWCTDLYRLSIANQFRDEIFWFPHSMDFRGRTYPLPPHFNHLGSDNVRGMLLFAKGKPLGKDGYDWLKIHLINLTGLKKRSSNAERLKFASSLMSEILDSANRPLTVGFMHNHLQLNGPILSCVISFLGKYS